MFTGLVQAVGAVRAVEEVAGAGAAGWGGSSAAAPAASPAGTTGDARGAGGGAAAGQEPAGAGAEPAAPERRIAVDLGSLPRDRLAAVGIGDSIALSGVCCTVVALQGGVAQFHLSRETLDRTWLGEAVVGTRVNLELALRAGDALGGHFVQGHVDGVGVVTAGIDREGGGELRVRLPAHLARYCVEKGSITLDGVSLTIAQIGDAEVGIAVIPHTAQVTTLGERRVGEPLHVEVDVLAKYVENLLHRS